MIRSIIICSQFQSDLQQNWIVSALFTQKDGDISWDNIEIWILAKILDTKTANLQLYDSTSPISVIVL